VGVGVAVEVGVEVWVGVIVGVRVGVRVGVSEGWNRPNTLEDEQALRKSEASIVTSRMEQARLIRFG